MGLFSNLLRTIITGQKTDGTGLMDVKTTSDGGLCTNQNITVDASNSSVANLAAGATFTGPSTADLNYSAIQYSFKSDQNCTVYIEQSPDGTNWDISDPFDYHTGGNGAANTAQLVSSFYRFRVTNVGFATTTFLRLQVVQVPFLSPLPRSLDEDGHLKVSIYSGLSDDSGFRSNNTPHGELLAVTTYRLIGSTFQLAALDSNFWTPSIGTGGTTPVADGELTLNTGTTANNAVSVVSTDSARYIGGTSNRMHSLIRLPDGNTATNNTRRWGIYDANHGAFFQVVNGVFSVGTRLNGTDTLVSNGSFNGVEGLTITLGALLLECDIVYSVDEVWFYLGERVLHSSVFHTANWTASYTLPLTLENTNTGGSTIDVALICRHSCVSRQGNPATQPRGVFQQGTTAGITMKTGAGNLDAVAISGVVNNSVVTLYDNTAASGKVIWTSGAMSNNTFPFDVPMGKITFSIGLTLVISGAACNALVKYE